MEAPGIECGQDASVCGRTGRFDAVKILRDLVLENPLVFRTVNSGADAFQPAVDDLAGFRARWPQQLRGLIAARYRPEAAPAHLASPPAGMKPVVSFAEVE